MKIYTRQGDDGRTGRYGGGRYSKDDPAIEVCGELDELNSALGLASAHGGPPEVAAVLVRVQRELFVLGAEVSAVDREARERAAAGVGRVAEPEIQTLEADIDRFDSQLAPLRQFILPGGGPTAAALHLARAICRRAERRVVSLSQQAEVAPTVVVYLNRLADLLFVLARTAAAAAGIEEPRWP